MAKVYIKSSANGLGLQTRTRFAAGVKDRPLDQKVYFKRDKIKFINKDTAFAILFVKDQLLTISLMYKKTTN